MAKRKEVSRTVQFWRLVDARDGSLVDEVDWDDILRGLRSGHQRFNLEGREHDGAVVSVSVPHEWKAWLSLDDVPNGRQPANDEITYGVVLAADKDYVPNQQDSGSGAQRPMRVDGDNWSAVDNLFVWHLPFGNMIGVLAESTSSSRAGKYAEWLTKATRGRYTGDPGFAWAVHPVIDKARAAMLQRADGLKAFVYAGEMGQAVAEASGARAIFSGPGRSQPSAIRIEVKASLVRGKSAPHTDERVLLDWFNETFGSLDGDVNKAQVTLAASDDRPASEIDLLHHRLTRKTKVPLALGATRSFSSVSAVGAIVSAFGLDRAELLRLRRNTD
jgi:hypothetical protein